MRHRNLYDLRRWRSNRLLLLGTGLALLLGEITLAVVRPAAQPGVAWNLVMSMCFAIAASYWVRQRWSYLAVEDGDLVVRVVALRHRVPLERVRRARVAALRSVLNTPRRQAVLPGRLRRRAWLDVEAVVLRLTEVEDTVRLQRLLGRRCVVESDVVVPVTEPLALVEAIDGARPRRPVGPAGGARRRRRR